MLRMAGFEILSAEFTEQVYGCYVCRRGPDPAAAREELA
jgi:hypothetical protein